MHTLPQISYEYSVQECFTWNLCKSHFSYRRKTLYCKNNFKNDMKPRYSRNLDDFCFINRNLSFAFPYVMVSTINTHDFDYTKECSTFFNNCK